jgi:hypothetical protein
MTDKPKKPIRVKVTYKTKTLAKGGPAEVTQSFHHGAEKRSYTPASVETGHPEYGKAGNGTNSGMNKALSEARAGKQEVAEHQGRGYKAGSVAIEKKGDQFKTSVKINPTIKMVEPKVTPVYSAVSSSNKKPRLKNMAITIGGSDRNANPANKSGVGTKRGIRITKSKSFKPPGQR